MALQKVFKESYIERLRSNIVPECYAGDSFDYDDTQIRYLANVEHPEGLLEKMNPDNDLESAIALYEAYPTLTPLSASKIELWVYLTHVDLFNYVQNRWPNVLNRTADAKYIQEHWFRSSDGIIRTTLANLWWCVWGSVDESRDDKYELTRMLFRHEEVRTRNFGASTLFRHREAIIGILEFLVENPDVSSVHFIGRCIYITRYFNRLGAVKQLAYMDRDFFKNELMKKKSVLLSITSRDQVLNNRDFIGL